MGALKRRICEFYLPKDTQKTMLFALDLALYEHNNGLYGDIQLVSVNGGTPDMGWGIPAASFQANIIATSHNTYIDDANETYTAVMHDEDWGSCNIRVGSATYKAGQIIDDSVCSVAPVRTIFYGDWTWEDAEYTVDYEFFSLVDADGNNLILETDNTVGYIDFNLPTLKAITDDAITATITDVPAFNSTLDAVIYYRCSTSNATIAARCAIYDSTGKKVLGYYTLPTTGTTSYTIGLSTADHNKLMALITSGTTTSLTFRLEIRIGDDQTWTTADSFTTVYTVVGSKPTITPSITLPTAVTNLTGSNTKVIRYYSYARCQLDAAPGDSGATITSRAIIYNGETRTVAAGAYIDIPIKESSTFTFRAIDSRGAKAEQTITLDMVEYIPLTFVLASITPPDAATGAITFVVKGNYFNGFFGSKSNTLDIQYRYKLTTGNTYSEWTSVPASDINIAAQTTYSCKSKITGLDYTKVYEVELRASDKINNITLAATRVVATPVFDWSMDDFNFNVPVTLTDSGKTYNLLGLIKAMTEPTQLTPQYSTSGSGGWSTFELSNAYLIGNTVHVDLYAKGGTVAAGTTNTTIGNAILYHGGKIASAPVTITFNSGKNSYPATLYTMNHNVANGRLTFTIMMSGTSGSTNTINAHLAIPVVLNTDAFIQ